MGHAAHGRQHHVEGTEDCGEELPPTATEVVASAFVAVRVFHFAPLRHRLEPEGEGHQPVSEAEEEENARNLEIGHGNQESPWLTLAKNVILCNCMSDKPILDERIKGRQGYGLIQLIHGHGKGKTTAALGQAVRCAGAGKRVLIVYFDKGGTSHYSERCIIDQIEGIDYVATGRDRIDPVTNRFDFSITDEDRAEAAKGIEVAKAAMTSGEYDLVILDEINSTQNLGMLSVDSVLDALQSKTEMTEVILTGRNPAQEFLDAAHLVTEMQLQRHYFYSGVPAREGLDF